MIFMILDLNFVDGVTAITNLKGDKYLDCLTKICGIHVKLNRNDYLSYTVLNLAT